MLRKKSTLMSYEEIFSDVLLGQNQNCISRIDYTGQGYEITLTDTESAIRLKSAITAQLKSWNNHNCRDGVRYLGRNNLPSSNETNMIEVWGDSATELSNYLEFCIFKSDYNKKYSSTLFTNPFSKMKQSLMDGSVKHIDDVKNYAKQNPDSRTKEVLQEMQSRNSKKHHDTQDIAKPDKIFPKIIIINNNYSASEFVESFGEANFPNEQVLKYTGSAIINNTNANNGMECEYNFEFEALEGKNYEYLRGELSTQKEVIQHILNKENPTAIIIPYNINCHSEMEKVIKYCNAIRQVNTLIPIAVVAEHAMINRNPYRRLSVNEIQAEKDIKTLKDELPPNTCVIKTTEKLSSSLPDEDIRQLKKVYEHTLQPYITNMNQQAARYNKLLKIIKDKIKNLESDLDSDFVFHKNRKKNKIEGLNALEVKVTDEKKRILNGGQPRSLAKDIKVLRFQYPLLDAGYFSETRAILDMVANLVKDNKSFSTKQQNPFTTDVFVAMKI